eukprot:COSAG01_NODE_245_length_20483_cov_32.975314_9_plen_99_part_00
MLKVFNEVMDENNFVQDPRQRMCIFTQHMVTADFYSKMKVKTRDDDRGKSHQLRMKMTVLAHHTRPKQVLSARIRPPMAHQPMVSALVGAGRLATPLI